MDYKQAIEYIEELSLLEQKRPSLPSLTRMQTFLSYYSSPQNSFKAFHVAGTNGKGSTVTMLDYMLRQSKKKIARYTGPHILSYNERFHINGQIIGDEQLASIATDVRKKSEDFAKAHYDLGQLSWFEFLTAIAFFYFAQSKVDIAAIEVGLGGRFDATNVLNNLYAAGITNISLDHQKILGNTLQEIAFEKAGIIKTGIPIVTAAEEPALRVIQKRALELNAPFLSCPEHSLKQIERYAYPFELINIIKNTITSHGIYQYQNALVALAMLVESNIVTCTPNEKDSVKELSIENAIHALENFYWLGRFEIIESEKIILDGAHNPAGIAALRQSLDSFFPNSTFHFIFACFHDKDATSMLVNLVRNGDKLYLPTLAAKRPFQEPSVLANIARSMNTEAKTYPTVKEAFTAANADREPNEFIVAAGSFYLLKEVMPMLRAQ